MKAVTRTLQTGLRALALAGAICLAATAAGEARTAACDGLERQLARAQAAQQGGSGPSKWQEAARQQAAAIAAAERDAAYFRCSAQPGTPKCSGLIEKIGRMKANLAKIERQRARSEPAAGRGAKDVIRLQAALLRNRCSQTAPRSASADDTAPLKPAQPSGLIGRMLGAVPDDDRPLIVAPPAPGQSLSVASRPAGLAGETAGETAAERRSRAGMSTRASDLPRVRTPAGATFRTLCVRTCDGYFFPISFSTTSDQFPQDAQVCSSMCPAAQTELFIYRNPGGEPEDMVSLAGVAYKELPNAFRHRKEYVEGCSCQARQQEAGASGRSLSLVPIAGTPLPAATPGLAGAADDPQTGSLRAALSPIPAEALPEDADPDTRQNLAEGFDPTVRVGPQAGLQATPAAGPGDLPGASHGAGHGADHGAMAETHDGTTAAAPRPDAIASEEAAGAAEATQPRSPVRQVGPKFFPDR
ncbi:DUF2865 domain-containing protein [Microvirga tunisiensis]|uniref:DUF2865 domain-containing protein n=1 Tax=Pannonibacter tanglangensis TaxID=2750084 RepID=A0A7X5F262_9HYPH|nr:DUF2865 domain-containing protein [Pannonibacter sp. XCT-53]NBN78313.1 DUF2865 domain-containing protein [Pannonibacter sp. XCT-53]